MGNEDMPHDMDTIIYLVQKLVAERGSPSSKRRRTETRSLKSEEKVDKIYSDSPRLRQCSRYFATSMKERRKPLSSQMEHALSQLCTTPDSCHLFDEAFEKIMSGSNDYAQVQCMTPVKTETERLLLSFKTSLLIFLLKEDDVHYSMFPREDLNCQLDGKANKKWIKLVHSMFRDVLDGRLFLSSSDRYKLFMDWCGIFDPCFQHGFYLNDLSELFTTYIMTFPLPKQEEMIQCWEKRKDDGFGTYKHFVFHTYEKWMMRLVNELASNRAPELTAAEGELLDSGELCSSLTDTGKLIGSWD